MKTSRTVMVTGCDDETKVDFEATDDEWDVIDRLARLVTEKSQYGCQPRIKLGVKENEDI